MNMERDKKRLDYLDVLKGILIIFVVYQHVFWLVGNNVPLQVDNIYSRLSDFSKFVFLPYYMPAFFIVTGFCSSFESDFVTFLKKNILTILWPSLALGFGVEWFIAAMFGGKIVFWAVNHYIKVEWQRILLLLIFGFIGVFLASMGFSVRFWYIPHILIMSFYLCVGVVLKRFEHKKLIYILASVFFISSILVCFLFHYRIPFVVSNIYVTPLDYPLNVLLSISGTLMLWGICKLIKKNKLLEFFGRNSLVIYLVHISILSFIIPYISVYIGRFQTSWMSVALVCAGLLIVALLLSSIIAKVLNTKYLKWVVGKI